MLGFLGSNNGVSTKATCSKTVEVLPFWVTELFSVSLVCAGALLLFAEQQESLSKALVGINHCRGLGSFTCALSLPVNSCLDF